MKVVAIVAAGGHGRRLGGSIPKQLLNLGERTVLQWSVDALVSSGLVAEVIVVVPSSLLREAAVSGGGAPARIRVVQGGARRQDSVAHGFDAVPADADVVLVHDAARPFVRRDVIARTIDAAAVHGAAIAAVRSADTVKRVGAESGGFVVSETLPREHIWLAQTPQAFRYDVLRNAVALGRSGVEATDEAALAELAGHPVRLVEGDVINMKITTDADLSLCRALVAADAVGPSGGRLLRPSSAQPGELGNTGTGGSMDPGRSRPTGAPGDSERSRGLEGRLSPGGDPGSVNEPEGSFHRNQVESDVGPARRAARTTACVRVGVGYDLHRFTRGRRLVLGGIDIPHEFGLAGHSDADAIAHAVTDAVLGAAGLGDIGSLFPDTDPRWENADSMRMLREAVDRVHAAGFRVSNADVVVIAQRPRIGPYRDAIRANLAAALSVPADRVSVKGKTNEGVDALGRGEALAVHAVAVVTDGDDATSGP